MLGEQSLIRGKPLRGAALDRRAFQDKRAAKRLDSLFGADG